MISRVLTLHLSASIIWICFSFKAHEAFVSIFKKIQENSSFFPRELLY